MSSEKRVSIHWIKAILASAKALGIDTNTILSKAQITLDLEKNHPSYLSLNQTQKIWSQAESLSGHQHFGLVMGQAFRPSYFHVVAYLAMTSPNLKEAYLNFVKFLPLITEAASLSLHYEGSEVCIVFTPQQDQVPFSRHQYESALTLLLTFTRWLLGNENIAPNNVMFEHTAGPDTDLYKKVFSLVPKFNQKRTCIYFPTSLLETELIDSDENLHKLHLAHAENQLINHQRRSWKEQVLFSLGQLKTDNINKTLIAELLNISPRTLQRRLQEEGTNFQNLLDQHKHQQASYLIKETKLPFKVIATQLGFAEPSTFYRAVKRWFNNTPQALRQTHQK